MDATEQELADAAALGDTTGMFNCPHTGVALAALIKLLKAGKIDKSEHVVVISTAHGLKFTDFKVSYHEEKLDFPCHYANKPIELPPRVDAVKEALRAGFAEEERQSMSKKSSNPKNWNPATLAIHGLDRVHQGPLCGLHADRADLQLLLRQHAGSLRFHEGQERGQA